MTVLFRWSVVCLPGLLLVAAAGCGSSNSTVPVTGVVTLDGKPLEGATVSFVPAGKEGRTATGQTDSSGKFTLTSFEPGDGALEGEYKVGISKMEAPAGAAKGGDPSMKKSGKDPENDSEGVPEDAMLSGPSGMSDGSAPPPMPKSLIPMKYSNPDQSGITVTVKSGMDEVKIELKSGG